MSRTQTPAVFSLMCQIAKPKHRLFFL